MSECTFKATGRTHGKLHEHFCTGCGAPTYSMYADPAASHRGCPANVPRVPAPPFGPGSELNAMFSQVGVSSREGCNCDLHIDQMNRWGVEGCREHREEILGWLREGAKNYGWLEKLQAGINAKRLGLPLTIEDLLDESIRRAEAKQAE